MLIRICLAVIVLVGNASWLAAQQNLGTANFGGPKWEGPVTWDREDICICNQGHHLLHDPERLGVRKNQTTPFMLQYEWKLNRDEVGPRAVPSNRETWTEFADVLPIKLPVKLEREIEPRGMGMVTRLNDLSSQNLWFAAIAYRFPLKNSQAPVVHYEITKEPTPFTQQYEGKINCVPVITARAKTIEALEAKLLELYCDYITQLVEEDTLQAINNAKASNLLGCCDIPAVQFGY